MEILTGILGFIGFVILFILGYAAVFMMLGLLGIILGSFTGMFVKSFKEGYKSCNA